MVSRADPCQVSRARCAPKPLELVRPELVHVDLLSLVVRHEVLNVDVLVGFVLAVLVFVFVLIVLLLRAARALRELLGTLLGTHALLKLHPHVVLVVVLLFGLVGAVFLADEDLSGRALALLALHALLAKLGRKDLDALDLAPAAATAELENGREDLEEID